MQNNTNIKMENPMSIFEHPEIMFPAILVFLFLYYLIDRMRRTRSDYTNWPLLGMLPGMPLNLHRIHDHITEIICENGGSYWVRGPWFCNMDMLVTAHPDDIQHIFSKNFANYPKGLEFREKFDILGTGILSTDFELWEVQRKTSLSVLTGTRFFNALEGTVWKKIKTGLVPVLDHFCETGAEFDLQDIIQRFAFDYICQLLLNYDPCSLSVDLPFVPCQKAFSNALPALFLRYILPRSIWKMEQRLKIGSEKKLMDARIVLDELIYSHLSAAEDGKINMLQAFTKAYEENRGLMTGELKESLRDALLSFLFAGSDSTSTTLTWLFWLLSQNPSVESKILEEMERELQIKPDDKWRFFSLEESHKLVYLHGAICESLRLFPPISLQHRSPIRADYLPSGHYIRPNTKVVVSFYSVGRMETLWGKDCLEFKPERWITPRGSFKPEPSYKFPVFNVGPRTCVGKEMAFTEMKMTASMLIYHYKFHAVEGHKVTPSPSVVLHAKHGIKVVVSKRKWVSRDLSVPPAKIG